MNCTSPKIYSYIWELSELFWCWSKQIPSQFLQNAVLCMWSLSEGWIAASCGVKNSLPVWVIRRAVPALLHSHTTSWGEKRKRVRNQYVRAVALTIMALRGVISSFVFPSEGVEERWEDRRVYVNWHSTFSNPQTSAFPHRTWPRHKRYEAHMQMGGETGVRCLLASGFSTVNLLKNNADTLDVKQQNGYILDR